MSLDQVVNADAEEVLRSQEEEEEDVFFQDIEILQNHGIVSFNPVGKYLFKVNKIALE